MTPPHAPNTDADLNYGVFLPNWHVGAETEQLVEFAVAAEEVGWDGVFLADHLAFPHDRYEGPEAMTFHGERRPLRLPRHRRDRPRTSLVVLSALTAAVVLLDVALFRRGYALTD